MNRFALIITVLILPALVIGTGCEKEPNTESPYIEGLTIYNYPVIDGSTSTLPLNTVIACELMGLDYQWKETIEGRSSTWGRGGKTSNQQKRIFNKVIPIGFQYKKPNSQSGILFAKPVSISSAAIYAFSIFFICELFFCKTNESDYSIFLQKKINIPVTKRKVLRLSYK